MKKLLLFFVLLNFCAVGFAQQWTVKTPMPTMRNTPGAAVVNNIIYVIGGGDGTNYFEVVEAYDPVTDSWTTKAPMPTARGELGVAAVNGKIYAIGGYNGSALNVVEEYDPALDSWTTKASMPTTRSEFSSVTINNKIYAVGGWPGNVDVLEEYDPVMDTWSFKASISTGRNQNNGCAVWNNQMYFMGGKNDGNTTFYSINEAYDPINDSWNPKADLPQALFSGAAVYSNGEIHYLGGTDGLWIPNYTSHYAYNPNTDTWSTLLPLIHKRSGLVAVAVNGKMYAIGGYDSTGVTVNWNEEYSSAFSCAIPANGLIAEYLFNGNTNDISGNNNNGTNNGATLTTDRFGNSNAAYNFDGASYISIPNVALTGNAARSIFAWVRFNNPYSMAIVATGQNTTVSDSGAFNLVVNYGPNTLGIMGDNDDFYPSLSTPIDDGNWHLVGAVYDGLGTINTYVDGLPESSASIGYNTLGQTNYIGKSNDTQYPNNFFGDIDDIFIYDRALNINEIADIFCNNSTGIQSIDFSNSFSIYPNPSNGNITISNNNKFENATIQIFNILGESIFETTFSNLSERKIQLKNISAGIYLIKINDGEKQFTQKLIIE